VKRTLQERKKIMSSIFEKLKTMTLSELQIIWEALLSQSWCSGDFYDERSGIAMDDWAEAVQSEISQRRTQIGSKNC